MRCVFFEWHCDITKTLIHPSTKWNVTKGFEMDSEIINIYERPPKPPTFWNSYTRTLILDTIMKLSGTIGVTQKTMTLDTHVRLILLQTLNPQER